MKMNFRSMVIATMPTTSAQHVLQLLLNILVVGVPMSCRECSCDSIYSNIVLLYSNVGARLLFLFVS